MTLERRTDAFGNLSVVTTSCALCGEPLAEQQGMKDHLGGAEPCPARDVYAAFGALSLSEAELSRRLQNALEDQQVDATAQRQEASAKNVEQVKTNLVQSQLPKLDDFGFVDYDPRTNMVCSTYPPGLLDDGLELAATIENSS